MPFLEISTASARLGVSPQWMRRLVRSRPELGRMIGGRWRVFNGEAFAQLCKTRKEKTRS